MIDSNAPTVPYPLYCVTVSTRDNEEVFDLIEVYVAHHEAVFHFGGRVHISSTFQLVTLRGARVGDNLLKAPVIDTQWGTRCC